MDPARLSERLRAVNAGYIADGVGVAAAPAGVERRGGQTPRGALDRRADRDTADRRLGHEPRAALASNLRQAWGRPAGRTWDVAQTGRARSRANDPRNVLLHELTRAADGAGQIAAGAAQARHEVSSILEDPVGRRALDRLLITPETVLDHPELRRSFAAYITPDGRRSRIDLTQADRIYSAAAMDQVETIRRRTNEFLGDFEGLHVTARITGENAESADIRALIPSDQVQSWYVVPIGVFLVLILTLRDPWPASIWSPRWS